MVLEKLSEALKSSLRKLLKSSLVDVKIIDELASEINKSLIAADVNVDLSAKVAERIKRRALNEKPAKTLTEREHTVNIVYEELTNFLGKEQGIIDIKEKPTKILLVGLFGSGKTTTAGKLAKYYKKQGLKVCLVQTDTWRPAAYEQLSQLAEKIHAPFYGSREVKDPVALVKKFEKEFFRFDVVIIDTAGRDALNKELVEEIKRVREAVQPNESLLVISGDIGQAALAQAQSFKDSVGVTGVIVTKLDGTAKGGGALTAAAVTGARVKFIGIGEKIDALEEYKPKNFVSRLLGMGDLETLLKKAEEAMGAEDAEDTAKKLLAGEVSFTDLYKQMEAMKKMGPLSQIINMIPGMGMANIPKELLNVQEGKMQTWRYVIDSMTKDERDHPSLMSPSRIKRIANGSGRSETEVRELIKQHAQLKKVMKVMGNPRQLQKLQKMMSGGGLPKGFGLKF